jgi:hypothetical protein
MEKSGAAESIARRTGGGAARPDGGIFTVKSCKGRENGASIAGTEAAHSIAMLYSSDKNIYLVIWTSGT